MSNWTETPKLRVADIMAEVQKLSVFKNFNLIFILTFSDFRWLK